MLNENQFEVNKPISIGASSDRSLEQKIPVKVRSIFRIEELTWVIGNKNYSSWSLRPWLAMKQAGLAFSEIRIPR